MELKKILKKKISWPADYALLFVLMIAYYSWLQFKGIAWQYIGDPDGFYHAKIALFLRQGILLKSMPWMQFSTIRDHFTDHHLIYHILLVPFTYLGSPLTGIKIATVFFASSMVTVFYWLLKKLNISYSFIFAFLFITLNGLNFRLALVKANSLSLIAIWILIYAIYKQKSWLTALTGFLLIWTHGVWPLAILILILYISANILYNRFHRNKLKIFWSKTLHIFSSGKKINKNWSLFIALSLGLLAGLVINPYWPHNIYFYYQLILIGAVNYGDKFPVGAEWYGTTIMHIISSAPHLLIACFLASLFLFLNYKKISRKTWFSFMLAFIFLLLNIKSKRYVEYFLPFAMLFAACATTDIKNIIDWKTIKKYWEKSPQYIKYYLVAVFLVFATIIMPKIYQKTLQIDIPYHWTFDKFQKSALWLKENTPKNSKVMHDDWDKWPLLFYHNDHNYYYIGLDATLMYKYSPKLHNTYTSFLNGAVTENLALQIKEKIGAQYVFLDKNRELSHEVFDILKIDKNARLVYEDDQVYIFEIK